MKAFKQLATLFAALFLSIPAATAQERYQTVYLEPVNEADTLRWCWIDTESAGAERGITLLETYADLCQKRARYRAAQAEVGLTGDDEVSKALREQDEMWEKLRETYNQMLAQEGLGAEDREELKKALADIDRNKAESRRNIQAQLGAMAEEGHAALEGIDPSEFSDERMLLIKKNLPKYVLGGRLWGFDKARDFRHGFAAVARLNREGRQVWGFLNRQGRVAIPCQWDDVMDFNNRRYYSLYIWDAMEDEDDRPWTSVRKGDKVGMIDSTGVVRVPVHFVTGGRAQLVFHKTKDGDERAAACDPKTRKWGLIDLTGSWKLQPAYSNIWWDEDAGAYVYETGDYENQL